MRFSILAVAALCVPGVAAHAASITYTESVIASGSLNGSSFTNQLLTLSATSDSSTVSGNGVYSTPQLSISGSVGSIGSFTIAGGVVFSNENYNVGGFSDGALGDILDTENSAFATYDLKSPFGPVSGAAESSLQDYKTTTGDLNLESIGGTATFQAVLTPPPPPAAATPEPSTFALLGTGLVGIAGFVRRRLA